MTTHTTTMPDQWWMDGRDDYGRRTTHLYRRDAGTTLYYTAGVVCTLPRRTASTRPAGQNYLCNDWTQPPGEGITYHRTRAAAMAHLERVTG